MRWDAKPQPTARAGAARGRKIEVDGWWCSFQRRLNVDVLLDFFSSSSADLLPSDTHHHRPADYSPVALSDAGMPRRPGLTYDDNYELLLCFAEKFKSIFFFSYSNLSRSVPFRPDGGAVTCSLLIGLHVVHESKRWCHVTVDTSWHNITHCDITCEHVYRPML